MTGVDRPSSDSAEAIAAPDVGNQSALCGLMARIQPTEVYYLAAYHHSSQQQGAEHHLLISRSLEVNTLGLNNVLHAVVKESPVTKVFYAGSSRMFGDPPRAVQNEHTPFRPRCAYGISKTAGAQVCRYYRDTLGVFAVTGILYNHESPLRPLQFISKKIVAAAVSISRGSTAKLVLGSLDSLVDWGYAPDYTDAMWRMLQLENPVDCLIGTGILHSVRDFVDIAFRAVGLDWRDHVTVNTSILTQPSPSNALCADVSRLRSLTSWKPTLSFQEMIEAMIAVEKEEQPAA